MQVLVGSKNLVCIVVLLSAVVDAIICVCVFVCFCVCVFVFLVLWLPMTCVSLLHHIGFLSWQDVLQLATSLCWYTACANCVLICRVVFYSYNIRVLVFSPLVLSGAALWATIITWSIYNGDGCKDMQGFYVIVTVSKAFQGLV